MKSDIAINHMFDDIKRANYALRDALITISEFRLRHGQAEVIESTMAAKALQNKSTALLEDLALKHVKLAHRAQRMEELIALNVDPTGMDDADHTLVAECFEAWSQREDAKEDT